MDYRIEWSKTSLGDLRDMVRFIAKDDPRTAERFGERLIRRIEETALFPRTGRIVPEYRNETVREVVVTPYRLIYEIDDGRGVLNVLRIWHGARGEPDLSD